jgi:hypothetical protein
MLYSFNLYTFTLSTFTLSTFILSFISLIAFNFCCCARDLCDGGGAGQVRRSSAAGGFGRLGGGSGWLPRL